MNCDFCGSITGELVYHGITENCQSYLQAHVTELKDNAIDFDFAGLIRQIMWWRRCIGGGFWGPDEEDDVKTNMDNWISEIEELDLPAVQEAIKQDTVGVH